MIEILLLSVVFAAGTWAGGWWTIPMIAMAWSFWRRRAPWRAGIAAGVAWIMLLGLTIPWAPLGRLGPRLGGAIGVPGPAMLLLPPIFAFLLAWSTARVVQFRTPPVGVKG